MKNFARLLRFAWPYRLRFAVSLVCASIVAVLFFSELGAVYPLLHILFNNQNCQKWVAGRVEALDADAHVAAAKRAEVEQLLRFQAGDGLRGPQFDRHLRALQDHARDVAEKVREAKAEALRREVAGGNAGALVATDRPFDPSLAREERASVARLDEVSFAVKQDDPRDPIPLEKRRAAATKTEADALRWKGYYQAVLPYAERYLPRGSFATLVLLLGIVSTGVALKGLFLFCQEVLVSQIQQRSLFDIRNLFYRRTIALDLASFTEQGSAELMSRFTNDLDSVAQGFNVLLSKVMREPLRAFTCLSGALWLNWRLTFLALVLVPVSVLISYRAGKIMKRAVRRSLESMSSIYKILQETFQGIKLVKAFTSERRERRRFFIETKALLRKSVRVAMIDALSDPVMELIALTMVSITLLSGSYLVLNQTTYVDFGLFKLRLASGVMGIEDLLTLYTLLAGISDPIRKLSNVHAKVQRAAAASDRVCALMDREPTVSEKAQAVRMPRHRECIEFDQVRFAYDERGEVLHGIDLTIRHGETIALVGPNGCGKSTLLSLLPRFWDVTGGAVRIDGHDLRDVSVRSLRSQISLVAQETVLFDGTIVENIAYGRPHATQAEVEAAARRAYAHAFISGLTDGYDTRIGTGGTSLSGGQRQRIALARAMLRDPAVLLLDEATSAVDIQDEALIRKAIAEFSRDRTTLLITHSLGALQTADRIVLMNQGRIEAVGTDAELRRTSALYRRLHEIHFHRESA